MSTPRADHELIERLRADLDAAALTVDAVTELLGPVAAAALHREQPVPARRVLAESRAAAATLIRLFSFGEPLPPESVAAALPRLGLDDAVRLGLVAAFAGTVRALVDLRPYGDEKHTWWLISDLSEFATGRALPLDHVLGVGGASTTLASWTPRRPASRALDLGTGGGVQALHLATHAEHVVATDLSARALAFAAFNAVLNRQAWELRQGSMLDPVAGEEFDLIVSNPPFVITPRVAGVPHYEYRDAGVGGDEVTAALVAKVGAHLSRGGVAQLLGNWEVRDGQDWTDVLNRWLQGTGLDAWVVQREHSDPAEYAEVWIRDGGQASGSTEYDRLYRAWLDDFAERGVTGIGFGVVTLQRPDGDRPPFVELLDHRGPVAATMGPSIDAGLAARTWLAEHTDAELLQRRWCLADDVTREQHYLGDAVEPSVILARQGGGLGVTIPLDTLGAALISVADGELSADQVAVAVAALTDTEPDAVRADMVRTLRAAVRDGLLVQG